MLENYIAFIGSSLVIILAPGVDILFSISQGLNYGKKAGVLTALGLSLGNIVHTLFVAFGISLIILKFPSLFLSLKIIGCVYLLYIALMMYKSRNMGVVIPGKKEEDYRSNSFGYVLKGFAMNVLNPKVIIFFIAFLSQFVLKSHPLSYHNQVFVLGSIFVFLVFLVFGSLSYFAGAFSEMLRFRPKVTKYLNVSSCIIILAMAIKLLTVSISLR